MKDEIISAMNKRELERVETIIRLLEEHVVRAMTGDKMACFMTCDECGEDYLVDDKFLPEPDIEHQTICRRCFELYHRDAELEEQRRDAYRQAKERM